MTRWRYGCLLLLSLLVAAGGCSDDTTSEDVDAAAVVDSGPDIAVAQDSAPGQDAPPADSAAADQGSTLTPPQGLEDLAYLGAFRLKGKDEGGNKRLGYSEGVIALDGKGNLWVASHTYVDLFGSFKIPASLGATLAAAPVVNQSGSWVDVTQGVQSQISGDRNVRGLLRLGSGWLYTVQEYYNGDASHDPVLGYEKSGLWKTTHHSQATAGYLARIHAYWAPKLGVELINGLAGTTIHQQASHGPVAHGFNLDPAKLPAAAATVTTTRLAFYPLYSEHADFTDVSSIRGAAFTRRAVYFFGTKGLGKHWYGEATVGNDSDPCGSGKGYHAEDRTTWVWVVDPAELVKVKSAGASARVPVLHSGSLNTLLKVTQKCARISGASYDHAAARIYLTTQDFAVSGEPQPAVHVLQVKTK